MIQSVLDGIVAGSQLILGKRYLCQVVFTVMGVVGQRIGRVFGDTNGIGDGDTASSQTVRGFLIIRIVRII